MKLLKFFKNPLWLAFLIPLLLGGTSYRSALVVYVPDGKSIKVHCDGLVLTPSLRDSNSYLVEFVSTKKLVYVDSGISLIPVVVGELTIVDLRNQFSYSGSNSELNNLMLDRVYLVRDAVEWMSKNSEADRSDYNKLVDVMALSTLQYDSLEFDEENKEISELDFDYSKRLLMCKLAQNSTIHMYPQSTTIPSSDSVPRYLTPSFVHYYSEVFTSRAEMASNVFSCKSDKDLFYARYVESRIPSSVSEIILNLKRYEPRELQ